MMNQPIHLRIIQPSSKGIKTPIFLHQHHNILNLALPIPRMICDILRNCQSHTTEGSNNGGSQTHHLEILAIAKGMDGEKPSFGIRIKQ